MSTKMAKNDYWLQGQEWRKVAFRCSNIKAVFQRERQNK
jgi:hypothetical protein